MIGEHLARLEVGSFRLKAVTSGQQSLAFDKERLRGSIPPPVVDHLSMQLLEGFGVQVVDMLGVHPLLRFHLAAEIALLNVGHVQIGLARTRSRPNATATH